MNTIRLVQLQKGNERRVALVEEPRLRLLNFSTVYELLAAAMKGEISGGNLGQLPAAESLEYDPIYAGASGWRLLAPIDHPEPARCVISGTGLTHLGSAREPGFDA